MNLKNVKTGSRQFLGEHELRRLKKSLGDDGFVNYFKLNSSAFGVIDDSLDGSFLSGFVEAGTNSGTIKINELKAFDKNLNFLNRVLTDNFAVPNDNTWYWLKAAHSVNNEEEGTVSIDTLGNLTGIGTFFTQYLRGGFHAVKISFVGATLNTGEYIVNTVINDTNAILNGSFQNESSLKVKVTGAFDLGITPQSAEKNIYEYNYATYTLVQEVTPNTPPALIQDVEFVLARVKNNAGTLNIEDKRGRNLFQLKSSFQLDDVDKTNNPLIGVEQITYDESLSPRDKNILHIAWGFRSTNWSVNSNLRRVTLSGGLGGVFKSPGNFTDGDFDGWLLYADNGKNFKISSSLKAGTQINLTVDTLDPDDFADPTKEILVVPDVEEIEIEVLSDNRSSLIPEKRRIAPIKSGFIKMPVGVYSNPFSTYNLRYRLKKFKEFSEWKTFPSDAVGYLDENSFNNDGTLKEVSEQTRVPYTSHATNGFITVTLHPDAYSIAIGKVSTGDASGFKVRSFNNAQPLIQLTVGQDESIQLIDHTQSNIDFSVDHYIDLKIRDSSNNLLAKDGSSFIIEIDSTSKAINLNSFTLKIVTGFINPGSPGTEILNITQELLDKSKTANFRFKFTYDIENDQFYYFEYNQKTPDELTADQKAALAGTSGTPSSSNKFVTENDSILDNIPSSGEKAALVGTSGSPSASNRYITNSDGRIPTSGEKAALVGSFGDPGPGNKYITETDPKIPSQVENDALQGTSGSPSDSNRFVTNSDNRLSDSRPPNGVAGGDLQGSYPNPTIKNNIVSNSNLVDDIKVGSLASLLTANKNSVVGAINEIHEELLNHTVSEGISSGSWTVGSGWDIVTGGSYILRFAKFRAAYIQAQIDNLSATTESQNILFTLPLLEIAPFRQIKTFGMEGGFAFSSFPRNGETRMFEITLETSGVCKISYDSNIGQSVPSPPATIIFGFMFMF